jgi:cobalt-zinc-cadmium efflux system outer membrane protein
MSAALLGVVVAAGAIAEGDLLRFQVSEAQFQQAQLGAELAYRQAVRDLAGELAGPGLAGMAPIAPETALAPRGELAATVPELSREDVRRRAQGRPDVISADRQVEAAEAALRLADAQRVPNVTLGLSGGHEGPDTLVGVSASIELPVFNGYTGAVVQAEALRRQAVALRQQALSSALADADKTWLAYDAARRVLAIYDGGTIERARAALAATETAYREGSVDLIAVLDARRTYDQVRMAWLQALYDARIGAAQVELLGSGGGGNVKAAAPSGGAGGAGND